MKNKILQFISSIKNWVRTDGMLHITVSALICVLLGWARPLWVAPLVTFAVGVGKEVYDRVSGRGMAEWHDIICDVTGIALGMLCIFVNL